MFFIVILIENERSINKTFKPPRVFIDEYNSECSGLIKLLRNLSRILGLPCILASTNAKINNLLNVSSASASSEIEIWVNGIRILPKANLRAIFHNLGWGDFINNENLEFNLKELLDTLNIRYDGQALRQLENLVKLMKNQCETCLQGVAIIVFQELKHKLVGQQEKQLDVKDIWKDILIKLRSRLQRRKPLAFENVGRYHTLAMMTSYQMILAGDTQIDNQPTPTSEIVLETINQHYYFFGRITDPVVIPFGYYGNQLSFKDHLYMSCSHFKLFFENVLFCLAMWIGVQADQVGSAGDVIDYYKGDSIASIVSEYILKLRNSSRNREAAKNNFSSQECVIHWALCSSTAKRFSNLNPGFVLLKHFIFNVQINENTVFAIKNFNIGIDPNIKMIGFNHEINFSSSLKLETFLSRIEIPQLLPSEIVTNEIREVLNGLCHIGGCNRLADGEGIDIEFDLFFDGIPKKGYVECKYSDVNLGKSKVLEYVIKSRTKNSPFSMIVTFSMQKCLKSAASWNSGKVEDSVSSKSKSESKSKSKSESKKIKLTVCSSKEIGRASCRERV